MAKPIKRGQLSKPGPRSLKRVVRRCATCAEWLPQKMECRHVPNEAAPPESGCDGWIENMNPNSNWEKLAKERGEENVDLRVKYHELLMAVARKFDGESRHETALRYIREAESRCDHGPACESPNDTLCRPADSEAGAQKGLPK